MSGPPDLSLPDQFEQRVRSIVREVLSQPLSLPEPFRDFPTQIIEVRPPVLPATQVTGFTQFLASAASTTATISITSGAFTANPTGPTLSGLPDGNYVVVFGAAVTCLAGSEVRISFSANGAAASESNIADIATPAGVQITASISRATTAALSSAPNSLALKYRMFAGVTSTAAFHWLLALKYSNL